MTLDMDNHKLSYTVNDEDHGVATDELDKNKYRMIINFMYNNHEAELL